MNLLALDTATDTLAAALVCASASRLDAGGAAAPRLLARSAPGGAQASQQLWPAVHSLLAEAGIALADVSGVAAGCGPGAFTGVRTAVAAAQGLALGLGVPVLALDSLALVAEDARAQGAGAALWVAMDARMDEVYAGSYRWGGAQWQPQQAPALWTPEALAAEWRREPPAHVAGNALAAYGARLVVGAAAVWPLADRAGALARLAAQQAAAGAWLADPAELQPQYVRNRVAQTTAERTAQRTARAQAV